MKESLFQFTNPEVKSIEFIVCDDFHSAEKRISVSSSIKTNVYDIETTETECSALVEVCVEIGKKDKTQPFYIRAVESAKFKWKKAAYSDDEIDSMLNKNGVALLISYLRPIIASVTGFSRYNSYNLPFIDLTSPDNQ